MGCRMSDGVNRPRPVWSDYGAYYKVKQTEAYFSKQDAKIKALQAQVDEMKLERDEVQGKYELAAKDFKDVNHAWYEASEAIKALQAQVDEMKWHKWRNDPRDTGRIAVMDKPKSVWNDYGAYYKVKETEAYFAEQEAQIAALQTELAEAENYATNLANVLYEKHWSHQTEWELLPNLIGVLTQIDNMTAGLSQGESHD